MSKICQGIVSENIQMCSCFFQIEELILKMLKGEKMSVKIYKKFLFNPKAMQQTPA